MRGLAKINATVIVAGICVLAASAQESSWSKKTSNTTASFRGLDVDAECIWVSGTNGRFLRSMDGGNTWLVGTVPGAINLDLRDIEAFGRRTAYVMSAGEGSDSKIFKTTDAGRTWSLQHTLEGPAGFFDSMAFWDEGHGIVLSDPIEGKFLLLTTSNGGRTWERVAPESLPAALEGEAAFAASGTCLVVHGKSTVWFATGGGRVARVFRSTDRGRTWSVHETPIRAGKPSAGIFSIAFADASRGIAVGGDYLSPADSTSNVAVTDDGGRTWSVPVGAAPRGYRSGVAYEPGTNGLSLLAVGTSGMDRSADGGKSWTPAGGDAFNGVGFLEKGSAVAVGPAGSIAVLGVAKQD
jgi:photosystem II stability/assembly factor-like uncharacterized protein